MAMRFPGLGGGEQLPSGDPVLPGDIVGDHMGSAANDQVVGREREALLSGAEQEMATLIEGVMTALASAAASRIDSALDRSGYASVLRRYLPHGLGQRSSTSSGFNQQPNSAPATAPAPDPTPQPPPEGEPPPDYHPLETFKEGQRRVSSMTMGQAAKESLRPLARAFSESGQSRWHYVDPKDASKGYVRRDTDGNIVEESNEIPTGAKVIAGSRALAAGLAAGEGVVGSLGAAATRVAGPIGLAIGGAQLIGSAMESQQAAAQPYRAAFGEQGTGLYAAEERGREWLTGLTGFGTIGMDQARANFQTVSGMGLRGERRDEGVAFMEEMANRFGMSASESAKMVEAAAQQGYTSLATFTEGISEVSKAAVEAGRSSAEAAAMFVETQTWLAENRTGTGEGAANIATGLTGLAMSMPRALSDELGGAAGLAKGMLSTSNIMAMSAYTGEDPMAAIFQSISGDTSGQQAEDTIRASLEFVVEQVASIFGLTAAEMRAKAKRLVGDKVPEYEHGLRVLLALAKGDEAMAGTALMALSNGIASVAGIPVDDLPNAARLFWWAVVTTQKGGALDDADLGGGGKGRVGGGTSYRKGKTTEDDVRKAIGLSDTPEATGGGVGGLGINAAGLRGERPTDQDAFDAYVQHVNRTGRGSKVTERVLNPDYEDDITSAVGVDSMEDVKYRVVVNGKAKDLSLDEAIEQGHGNRLRTIVGDNPNDTKDLRVVLELTGGAADVLRQREGPSDEQRMGVAPPAYRNPSTYPRSGGR